MKGKNITYYEPEEVLITLTKNPPDNMNVMRVTEAKVVAFFTSMNAAPIAKPKP